MKVSWKNVLFSTHTKPAYMPPPKYGNRMVVCGPHYQTARDRDGNITSVQTPARQPYDIASLIAALPAHQKPDLLIVRVDAGMENMPENLAAVDVPKLAILGDSHHLQAPIQTLLSYALRQNFDFLVLDHNRQHAHWYVEAGLRNVVWIPALLLAKDFIPPVISPEQVITFIGQVGSFHPHRSRLIRHIQSLDLPMALDLVPHSQAAGRYNRSSITLNCSLNGDLNLRVFETLAAGGMLMTDRLSPLSGLYSLFSEGEEFVDYDSHDEFVDKAKHYLANPAERNQVAKRGFNNICRLMNMHSRTRTLDNLVKKGRIDPLFTIDSDLRMAAYGCRSKADLFFRISVYEWVQELHRQFDGIRVINTTSGDIRITCDLADLPRLSLFSQVSEHNRNIVAQSGLAQVVSFFGNTSELPATTGRSIIICSATQLQDQLEVYDPVAVIISDFNELDEQKKLALGARLAATGYEFGPGFAGLATRPQHWPVVT